jgi:drug/metabolite transporter (DMT)-like permease
MKHPLPVPATEKSAVLMVGCGAFLISFSGVFVKWADVSPMMAAFYRTFLGGIIIALLLLLLRKPLMLRPAALWLGLLAGVFFALDLVFWHTSIHFIGPGLSTILANFQVFLLALFGVAVLGEKLNRRLGLSILLAMAGLYLLAGVDWQQLGQRYQSGVLLGLAAAVCYAAYLLVLRRLQSAADAPSPLTNLCIISLVTAALLAASSWPRGDSFAVPNTQSWLALIAYAFFSQVCGWWLITSGLPRLRTSAAGLLLLLQPSLAFIWDVLLFDPRVTAASGCGAVVALGAIYLGLTRGADRTR